VKLVLNSGSLVHPRCMACDDTDNTVLIIKAIGQWKCDDNAETILSHEVVELEKSSLGRSALAVISSKSFTESITVLASSRPTQYINKHQMWEYVCSCIVDISKFFSQNLALFVRNEAFLQMW